MYFTDFYGDTFPYEVARLEVLTPEAVEEMCRGGDWDMTLFTCSFGNEYRIAARCRLTEP